MYAPVPDGDDSLYETPSSPDLARRHGPGLARRHGQRAARGPAGRPLFDRGKGGRLGRRTPEQIAEVLAKVVSAIRATKGKGLRSEQIRAQLGLDVREMPRVLHERIKAKKAAEQGPEAQHDVLREVVVVAAKRGSAPTS
jgi:hypothetical protein